MRSRCCFERSPWLYAALLSPQGNNNVNIIIINNNNNSDSVLSGMLSDSLAAVDC